MRLKFVKDEDFVNYRKASMFLGSTTCSFKCCTEQGLPLSVCQNEPWFKQPIVERDDKEIISRYLSNPFTHAIVFGGLEPFDQFDELRSFISRFREVSNDDVVIYVGYKEEEVLDKTEMLKEFPNIIIKFGRYVPNSKSRYDDVLGVTLASDNQYAKKIS